MDLSLGDMESTELQVLLSVLRTEELNNRCAVTNE